MGEDLARYFAMVMGVYIFLAFVFGGITWALISWLFF